MPDPIVETTAKSNPKSKILKKKNPEFKIAIFHLYDQCWRLTSFCRKMQFVKGRRCQRPILLRFSSSPNKIYIVEKVIVSLPLSFNNTLHLNNKCKFLAAQEPPEKVLQFTSVLAKSESDWSHLCHKKHAPVVTKWS